MQTKDFSFNLPEEQIAQDPPEIRGSSRLMVLNRNDGTTRDLRMPDFPDCLSPGSLLVFNNTRVRKARIFAQTEAGGGVEFLLLREIRPRVWEVIISRRKRQKIGRRYLLPEGVEAVLIEKPESLALIEVNKDIDDDYLDRCGAIPLPPYIQREAEERDEERYQTVYARETGSVAAPTAGLHFTEELISQLQKLHEIAYVTLHVGIGTFSPIRTDNLEEHRMHREEYEIPMETAAAIERAKTEGRDVVAVGTTTVRTLESAATEAGVKPGMNSTELFIRPGYQFKTVDRIFTNFHTPESSLLVMISAFVGRERILAVYREAVRKGYRFFSYGDAMFIQ